MNGWLRVTWVIIAALVITLALLPLQLLLLALRLDARSKLPKFWHRAILAVIGIRVHRYGALDAGRPLMLASNHVSWKDILILGACGDVTFVAKAEVRKWPIFGVLARLQRTVFVEPEQRRKSGEQANEMADRMAAGEMVVLFPEGTTSDGNRLMPVKSSLFGAATSAIASAPDGIVHVQPVALAYTHMHGLPLGHYHRPYAAWPGDVAMLPHLLGILRTGALDVDICFGRTLSVSKDTNRKLLSAEAEGEIRRMLAERLRGR